MKTTILAALLILAGCGGGSHHHAPRTFPDIAGHYTATVTAHDLIYGGTTTIGQTYDVTIAVDGTVTAGSTVYHLTRLANGTFQTLGRPYQITVGGVVLTEYGTAPADLATFRLRSYYPNGALGGTLDTIVVKLAGG